jgi:hypothetical protein
MIPAARLKSEGLPAKAAMMKSAGEQSAGQAVLQGFCSQYSQRLSSLSSWASVKNISISLWDNNQFRSARMPERGFFVNWKCVTAY